MSLGEYMPIVRNFVESYEMDFPDEHFGVADKFLLGMCVKKVAEELRGYRQDRRILLSAKTIMAVRYEMRMYGFSSLEDYENFF